MCTWFDNARDLDKALEDYPKFKTWMNNKHTSGEIEAASIMSVDEWFDDFMTTWINPHYDDMTSQPMSLLMQSIDINKLALLCSWNEDGGCAFCYDPDSGLVLDVVY
ncbi:hypothetical protein EJ419_06250 [Alloscardovia theropitheci]|uniref:Uncharacterized protein n=1 Tax=Alloscardovia theropitheci TaxID=2496842 RepID=A0A4R0QWG3_9BIFI|nr:hypothetical protein [Alloscardovia theropitheci]TCD53850.1 hypothetical protein EJ419_06250 [Alloscardovia theropitheci]